MKYGYYPGCSLHSTGAEYDVSFKAVCEKLDIQLEEVPNWLCCGTSPAHSTSHLLSLALPIKNLALAEGAGLKDMVVPCAACFSRFKIALHETEDNEKLSEEIKEIISGPFKRKVNVLHPLEIFAQMDPKALKEKATQDLSHLKVVCYYGCLLTRPAKAMQFDICEYPMTMDKVLDAMKIPVLDWSYKTDCCGGSFALSETDAVLTLTHKILENAKAVGANAIAVACPLCHANLDTRQTEIEAKYETQYGIPILYFTQLMGLALGVESQQLGLNKHLVSTEAVLNKQDT
ncbi:CoB--CoM heterodisulfide reductase iron-sulfur subunit B family protein [Planctomycetota bacterium]